MIHRTRNEALIMTANDLEIQASQVEDAVHALWVVWHESGQGDVLIDNHLQNLSILAQCLNSTVIRRLLPLIDNDVPLNDVPLAIEVCHGEE